MKNILLVICILSFHLSISTSLAADRVVVVVPLGGTVGNAVASDVIKGKTFSSKVGKGVTGTLVLPPTAQTYTNSNDMTFNLLQNDTFIMGSSISEPGHLTNETLHQVTLTKSFYMQTTEVTNKQWNTLIIDNTGFGTVTPSTSHTGDNYPVENVNWFEAAFFANTLSAWESL